MNGFLLETNVISELIEPQPDGNVLRWIAETDEALLFLGVLTLGNIRNGIEKFNRGGRATMRRAVCDCRQGGTAFAGY